jgi:fatty acid desaturase
VSAKELRTRYNRQLTNLSKLSNVSGWLLVGFFVSQIAVAVVLGHFMISGPSTAGETFLAIFLILFIGTRLRALNNIVHEASHASFVTDRSHNVLIGKLCSALTLGCFLDYRDEHLSHHVYVGDYDRDLDFQGIKELALHEPLTTRTLLRHIVTPLVGRHLPYYLHLNRSRRDGQLFTWIKLTLLICVVAIAFLAPVTALLFLVVPFVLVYSALNYWADCMDHAGLVGGEDELVKSRNILVPRMVGWLFFPRHDCFHLVHHLFPQVPARHLETAHRLLAEDEIYKSKQNAMGVLPSLRLGASARIFGFSHSESKVDIDQ